MHIKEENGVTGVDIVISVIIITIFIALIANLIANININSKNIERRSQAISYAVDEIEKIKAKGYIESYNNKGIQQQDILTDEDINDENGKFTGFHKTIYISDYVYIKGDSTKQNDLVKQITVKIAYNTSSGEKSEEISTYITKESNNEK